MNADNYYDKVLNIAKRFCGKSEKCSFDVLKKLEYYKITPQQKRKIIKNLEKEGFIDEKRYVKAFVNDRFKFNKWGKIKISHALRIKNISEEIINKFLNTINDNEYKLTLSELVEQKNSQLKEKDNYKRKASLFRFATSRGFEYDLIGKVLDELKL